VDYIGTGARLQPGDIGKAAQEVGLPTAVLLAWLEVEVGATIRGFDNKNRIIILPEPHRFYANLGAGPKRAEAIKQGLAYAKWGAKPYPASYDARYEVFAKMEAIDVEAARDSASQGLPQILGQNAEKCGYANATAMFTDFMLGETQQLKAMVTLMKNWGIVTMLSGKNLALADNWRPAAFKYNGTGYEKNGYHTKLATAFVKHSKGNNDNLVVVKGPAKFTVLKKGMKGELVTNLQSDLLVRGFDPGPIDGRFEDKTKTALEGFQRSTGLTVDGEYGPKTAQKMATVPMLPIAPKPPEHVWPQQQSRNWVAVLIDTLLDMIFAAFRRKTSV